MIEREPGESIHDWTDKVLRDLDSRVAKLELANRSLGPQPIDIEGMISDVIQASVVDRTARVLVSGNPVPEDNSHTKIQPNGQQKDYVVLSDDERAKGFVRPYRDAYRHQACGHITTMGRKIAETYAAYPKFYSGTFCSHCGNHFPVGPDGEFTWYEMDGTDGPKVGT